MRLLSCAWLALAVLLTLGISSAQAADPKLKIENRLTEDIEIALIGRGDNDTVRFPKTGTHTVKPNKGTPKEIGNFPKGEYQVIVKVGKDEVKLDFDIKKELSLLIYKKDNKIVIEEE